MVKVGGNARTSKKRHDTMAMTLTVPAEGIQEEDLCAMMGNSTVSRKPHGKDGMVRQPSILLRQEPETLPRNWQRHQKDHYQSTHQMVA
jgi:hypothetical protein